MKKFSIILIAGLIVAACSKKNTPAGTATSTVASAPSADAPKPSKEAAAGMETYNAKCGRCHELKKVDNYTASQWVPIVDDMAVKAQLDAAEKANVLAYVQFYAKAGK